MCCLLCCCRARKEVQTARIQYELNIKKHDEQQVCCVARQLGSWHGAGDAVPPLFQST